MTTTNPNTQSATIATWRERIGAGPDFPLHAPTAVERAMEAEIAELHAALARSAPPAGNDKQIDDYQPGQWWIRELENLSVLAEPTDNQVRAARIALDFAEQVFAARAAHAQDADSTLQIAQDAVQLMTTFHGQAAEDDTPDMNAVFPAAVFRDFVDVHARLLFRLARLTGKPSKTDHTEAPHG